MELIGVEGNLNEDLDFDEHSCLIEIINLVQLFETVILKYRSRNSFGISLETFGGVFHFRERANKVKRGSERERALWRLIKSFILRI